MDLAWKTIAEEIIGKPLSVAEIREEYGVEGSVPDVYAILMSHGVMQCQVCEIWNYSEAIDDGICDMCQEEG